jgi:hypothetical protein
MSLTCPRCETDVPIEAHFCPYCSLPKPKSGFAVAVEADLQKETKPKRVEKPRPPVELKNSSREQKRSPSSPVKTSRPDTPRRLRLPVLSVAALVALLSVGAYIFVVPLVYSEKAEPKAIMSALDTLRRMPSNEPGLTIDARLTRELETARRVKNLVSYQGWTARPIKGTTTKVLLAYSYQEVGDVIKRAEWIADLTANTFTPQTDMAAAVSSR